MKFLTASSSLFPLLGVAVPTLGLGFGLGRMTSPSPDSKGSGPSLVQSAVRVGPQRTRTFAVIDPVEVAGSSKQSLGKGDLMQAIASDNPKARERNLDALLAKASLGEVRKLLDWAKDLPEGAAKKSALGKIMERWGEMEGPAAAAYAQQVLEQTGNPALLREAMKGWAQTDPEGSLQHAQGLPVADAIRRDISRDIVSEWSDHSPEAAAAYIQSGGGASGNDPNGLSGRLASLVADRWSQQNPAAAAAWAASLPPGRDQLRALDQVVQNWAGIDLKAAADFVGSQPGGLARDAMTGTIARNIGRQDASQGLGWAATISDQNIQERTAMGILWRSASQNPAQMQQLVQGSTLADSVKQDIITRFQNRNANSGAGVPPSVGFPQPRRNR